MRTCYVSMFIPSNGKKKVTKLTKFYSGYIGIALCKCEFPTFD